MGTIEFLFDFGSPNAYLSHRVLPSVAERTGAELIYTPVLLGGIFKATGNVSPAISLQGVPSKQAYQRVEIERFLRRHGIDDFGSIPSSP
jgi:2-hydroxychromene-2-carboxylate isomerase